MTNLRRTLWIGAAAATAAVLASAAAPAGWFLAGNKPANYDTGIDRGNMFNGRPSAYLKAKANEDGFGTLMQEFSADRDVGKRVRLSGHVKSDGVSDWAGLWMRVDGKGQNNTLAFDNMQDRAIKGSTPWQRYEVVLDVPQGATGIALGILLHGPGQVWLNSTTLEVVGTDVPLTGHSKPALPDGPHNLSLDQ